MAKQLLIETGFISQIKMSNELKESLSLSAGKNNTLIVRNIPCTILNRKNLNGRIYSTQELQKAIKNAEHEIQTKQLLCQACEHPEGTFCVPTVASHVVTKAYIKPNVEVVVEGTKGRYDVLFMDWEVLNTEEGKNLRALLEAECSVGTSIRGVGDMDGDTVINYELLGCDVVSNPSSGTFTRMPVKESVTLDVKENTMNEAFNVETETVDNLADINQASELLRQLGQDKTTTMSKSSLKFDSEINPDTGAETNVAILTTNSSDDVDTLQQALQMAGAKMASTLGTTDSVTISRIEDEDAEANKESVEMEEAEIVDTQSDGSADLRLDQEDLAQVGQDALENGDVEINLEPDSDEYHHSITDAVEEEPVAVPEVFNWYEDAGHSWLEVPFDLLYEWGIVDDISTYSYMNDNMAYLEEDCDMPIFLKAYREHTGHSLSRENVNMIEDDRSPVRNYSHYKSAKGEAAQNVESLATDVDMPSDVTVQPDETLEEGGAKNSYTYEISNINFDIDEIVSDEECTREELESLLQAMPDVVMVNLELSEDEALDQTKVLEKVSDIIKMPIKSATVLAVTELENKQDAE